MFEVLGERRINIFAISTSEIKVSVIVDMEYAELAVRVLHTAFGLDAEDAGDLRRGLSLRKLMPLPKAVQLVNDEAMRLTSSVGRDRLARLMKRGADFLGCEVAVLGGAMSWISERHLVAALSNAGAFGVIACGAMTPDLLDTEIAETKQAHLEAVRRQPHHHAPAC